MTQEVRVMLQLTLDVDTSYSKENIQHEVYKSLNFENSRHIKPMMVDIIEIQEEAEIYGNK